MTQIGGILLDGQNVDKAALRQYLAAREIVSVKDPAFGAVGDLATDDLAAFDDAIAFCKTDALALFIPPCTPGDAYRMSAAWSLSDCDGLTIFGAGIGSTLAFVTGGIEVDSTTHMTLRDLGLHGASGSGHGLEIKNASHYNKFERIYIGHFQGAQIKIGSGQSNVFVDCDMDVNNGFNMVSLASVGLSNGTPDYGVLIDGAIGGNTNNQTFLGCRINACGGIYSLKVGDGGVVDSFAWLGGLIQGSAVYQEVYLQTRDGMIVGTHIEPPVGATANWVLTLDGCSNTVVREGVLQGDAQLIGTCTQSGFDHVRGCGVDIGASCDGCFVRDGQHGNISTGPGAGAIKDRGAGSVISNMVNAGNARVFAGRSVREDAIPYFKSNMEEWVGGGSPTVPCGFESFGTPTITRENGAGNVRSGSYSAKVVASSDLDEGFKIDILPNNLASAGRRIHVVAWVKNLTTAGLAHLQMLEGGTAATATHRSCRNDVFERLEATFVPNTSATTVSIRFTSTIGAVYWDSIHIYVEEHTPVQHMTLADSATPSLSYGGYPVRHVTTNAAGTAITGFTNPHVGVEVTITLGAATDFTDSAGLQLAGSANWTAGVAGDVIKIIYGPDGVFRQTAPVSVN